MLFDGATLAIINAKQHMLRGEIAAKASPFRKPS